MPALTNAHIMMLHLKKCSHLDVVTISTFSTSLTKSLLKAIKDILANTVTLVQSDCA